MKKIFFVLTLMSAGLTYAQQTMTPELLWQVKRVSPIGLSEDGKDLFYKVTLPNVEKNTSETKYYKMPVSGGNGIEISEEDVKAVDKNISPDGKHKLFHKEVHLKDIKGSDIYKDLPQSDVYVYNSLDYRHWDTFNEGKFNHVFYKNIETGAEVDIMENEPYYSPQAPFGGSEDYTWSPDGENIYYVSKKEEGTAYATSTNT